MSVDWLDAHPEQVKAWCNQEETRMFWGALLEMKSGWTKELQTVSKIEEIYRSQGCIAAINAVLDLPASVDRLDQDRRTGKRK